MTITRLNEGTWRSIALVMLAGFVGYMSSYMLNGYNKVSQAELTRLEEKIDALDSSINALNREVGELKEVAAAIRGTN